MTGSLTRFAFCVMIHVCFSTPTHAELIELTSTDNLQTLRVGEVARITATISNLSDGAELDSLFASATYDETIIAIRNLTAGSVVPSPLSEPDDFLAIADEGLVDVAFSTFSVERAHHIVSAGRFFEFEVHAIAEGAGRVSLDFASASSFNPSDPGLPIDLAADVGSPLEVTITAIPEPTTAVLLAMAILSSYRFFLRK